MRERLINEAVSAKNKAVAAYYKFAWEADDWLYQNVPSAVGVQRQLSPSTGTGVVEINATVTESWVFNWRSMQMDQFVTVEAGPSIGLTTPLVGASGGYGIMAVSGASSNDSLVGLYGDVTVNAYLGPGVYYGASVGLDNPAGSAMSGNLDEALFVDQASKMNVVTSYFGVGAGLPGVTAGCNVGTSISRKTLFDMNLPIPIIPPNNPHTNRP